MRAYPAMEEAMENQIQKIEKYMPTETLASNKSHVNIIQEILEKCFNPLNDEIEDSQEGWEAYMVVIF